MKRIVMGSWMAAVWVTGGVANAQLEVSWQLVHNRSVLMEPVFAVVRIAKYYGQDLDLTPLGNACLKFTVEDQPTSTVAETGRPLVSQAVMIPNGDTRDVEVNLLTSYRMLKSQTYMLAPYVEFAGQRFPAQRQALEIQPGLELLKRTYGIPSTGEARAVSLRTIMRDGSDKIFFRIDNPANGYCFGVYELGRLIRFQPPALEKDADDAFHALHQCAPDRYTLSIFTADGAPVKQTYYSAQAGKIRLEVQESGAVEVVGGFPFVEDENNPGILVAPALPPAHPYSVTVGELPRKAPAPKRGKKGR